MRFRRLADIWLLEGELKFHMLVHLTSYQRQVDATTSHRHLYGQRHEISNNVVCATYKASDQPAHTRSLIRAFASGLNII